MQEFAIVCFGDSVTLGIPHVDVEEAFPRLLERRLRSRYAQQGVYFQVINSGVGGENSAEGLARIRESVLDHGPQIVIVEFGLNDVRYEPEKHIPVPQFVENLGRIAAAIKEIGSLVILMTPNPIINERHPYSLAVDYYDKWGGCNQALEEYVKGVREAGRIIPARVCDIYEAFVAKAIEAEFRGETPDYRDLLSLQPYISFQDGVHPTPTGHQLIAQELYKTLQEPIAQLIGR
ncbi:MAG: SGNH/GDSL hydrolase family protein [Candidatus Zipacnadales bacterium]